MAWEKEFVAMVPWRAQLRQEFADGIFSELSIWRGKREVLTLWLSWLTGWSCPIGMNPTAPLGCTCEEPRGGCQRAAVIKFHKLGTLNNRNLFPRISGGQKSKIKGSVELVSSEGCEEIICLRPLALGCWRSSSPYISLQHLPSMHVFVCDFTLFTRTWIILN